MSYLLSLDTYIFFLINHLPHNALADALARFFSGIGAYGIVWFVIGGLLFLREEKKHHRFFVPILSVGLSSLFISEYVIKPLVSRVRPLDMSGTIAVVHASWYSFPSTHATASWAMAVVLSTYEPRFRVWWYALAIAISFSRVYLGVHFPIDVVAGAFLGWSIAKIVMYYTPKHLTYRGKSR